MTGIIFDCADKRLFALRSNEIAYRNIGLDPNNFYPITDFGSTKNKTVVELIQAINKVQKITGQKDIKVILRHHSDCKDFPDNKENLKCLIKNTSTIKEYCPNLQIEACFYILKNGKQNKLRFKQVKKLAYA